MTLGQHENRGSPEMGQLEQLRIHHEFILFSLRLFVLSVFKGAENKKTVYKETLGLVFHILSV
jgi:hypothetical protein